MKRIKSIIAIMLVALITMFSQITCYAADEWTPNLICDSFSVSSKSINPGDNFTLNFKLKNTSSKYDVRNVLIRISGNEAFGINNSSDTIYKDSIKCLSSANMSKNFYCNENAAKGVYPVNVSTSYEYLKNGEVISESREFTINLKVNSNSSKKQSLTPQVFITDFSYGDSQINGGSAFTLKFNVKNNSGSIDIKNIIIKLSGGEAFVVNDGTDTLTATTVKAGKTASFSKSFKCLNNIQSGVYPIISSITYEYFEMNEKLSGSAELTMSIPVIQQDNVLIDGLTISGQTITAGQEADCAFKIINSGQTKLSNSKVNITDENNKVLASAFIGAVEAGTQFESNYTLPITLDELGKTELTFNLIYENENLEQKSVSQSFYVTVEKYNDPYQELIDNNKTDSQKKETNNTAVILGAVCGFVFVISAVIVISKIIKKKKIKKGSVIIDEEI